MLSEINMTQQLSPRDYSVVLGRLTDHGVIEETEKNQWLMNAIQMSDCDYHARYLECLKELHTRHITLDNHFHL
jgi:hypothetical protein